MIRQTRPRRGAAVPLTLMALLAVAAVMLMQPAALSAQTDDTGDFSRTELDLLALSPEARAIANKLQCPVCDGQAITESNATIARQMRARVQQLVDDGATEQEIQDFFVERYGPAVLREPRLQGVGWGVWLAPPLIALFGAVIVVSGLRRRRREQAPLPAPSSDNRPQTDDDEIVTREIGRITGDAD